MQTITNCKTRWTIARAPHSEMPPDQTVSCATRAREWQARRRLGSTSRDPRFFCDLGGRETSRRAPPMPRRVESSRRRGITCRKHDALRQTREATRVSAAPRWHEPRAPTVFCLRPRTIAPIYLSSLIASPDSTLSWFSLNFRIFPAELRF